MNWQFADRTALMKRSTIREILKLTAQPEMISFAGGLPAAEYFPIQRMQEAAETVLCERGREALQYSTTEGMPELRQLIADRFSKPHFKVSPQQVIIVSGSQQALDFIGRALLNDGDKVVVENPTYLGMLLAWKPSYIQFLPVPMDAEGLQTDCIPNVFSQQPKLMYSAPTFQNPTGASLSEPRRRELVKYLAEYGIPLVEDNAYNELRYSGEPLPSLLQCDAENLGLNEVNGHVVYMGTFSKIMTPGLRVGWIIAPDPLIEKIIQIKQAADLHTSTLTQFIVYEAAKDGFLDAHIDRLRSVYRERRDVMLAALERYFPSECHWTRPDGGLFLMVYLPENMDATDFLQEAIQEKVAFISGIDFFIGGMGQNTMRLNFSASQPDRIEEGIRRLGSLLKGYISKPRAD